jgi:hypothetical protein
LIFFGYFFDQGKKVALKEVVLFNLDLFVNKRLGSL